jgi:ABC-2 type transport system permease protein
MTPLLRAELLGLRTTRTFAALVAAALALSLLVVVLTAFVGEGLADDDVRSLFTNDFVSVFIVLLGVIGMAGEWRHRTIASTVLATPDRARLLAAKALSYALAGAVLSVVVTVAMMAIGTVILSARGEVTLGVGDLADLLWRNVALAALFGSLGVCVGGLVRNQVAAIVGLLVFAFVLEPAVLALAPEVGRFGPMVGAPSGILGTDASDDADSVLAAGVALLVMIGWLAVAYAAAAAVFRRVDLT